MVNSAKPTTKDQAHGLVRVFGFVNPRDALGGVGVRCWVDFMTGLGWLFENEPKRVQDVGGVRTVMRASCLPALRTRAGGGVCFAEGGATQPAGKVRPMR